MSCFRQKKIIILFLLFLFIGLSLFSRGKESIIIIQQQHSSPRVEFGIQKLFRVLQGGGYSVSITQKYNLSAGKEKKIVIGETSSELFQKTIVDWNISSVAGSNLKKEGFSIITSRKNLMIGGVDASGVLYGCLALIDEIKKNGKLPDTVSIVDQPEMVLRGACIGLQKPYYLPGRNVYEYPYTPETFPWFYDKELWIQVLDSMLENRMNSLYLWNGHPFASLVRLKDYPYAVEVDDVTFKKNEEMYLFLTKEADKRGIWIIQMFYNIIVSKPFAEKHGIKTQDRERPIIPLIADYTKKSIAAFVQKYPNVGLMVCLGEAMEGIGNDDIVWFTKTIIPGVLDGLKALGKRSARTTVQSGGDGPPIVLRAHDTDAPSVMKAALPLYHNLYTEAKFNGEALTTPMPRGEWAQLHQTLSKLGSVHIENVHILANLEPFRYAAVGFIELCVKGMHQALGGNGLHLYPQASYWDWPFTADSVKGKRLLQIERDWIWYKAWARYAWKANRDYGEEINYWSGLLADRYGCSVDDAKNIMDACEHAGEIAPVLLRRFGITDGNRQTLTLGMLMTQLINPFRYGLFTLLYDSEGPEGEKLVEYAEKEWKGQKHIGETPPEIISKVKIDGTKAVFKSGLAAPHVTKNIDEFSRLRNDIYCYRALAFHYAEKAEAALMALRYKYSNNVDDLEKALPHLEQSVNYYKELVDLTKGTYLYANSMQTQQRKIPLRGVNGAYKTWSEVLVPFEAELNHFRHKIDSLKRETAKPRFPKPLLINANVSLDGAYNRYSADSLARVFSDTSFRILTLANELKGLQGVQLSFQKQLRDGTELKFHNSLPIKLLVAYFNPQKAAFSKDSVFLKAPELETNAGANDYGQSDIKIANGIVIKGMPPVNIHSYSFSAGSNVVKLPKGVCLVLGFINDDEIITPYDAGLTETGTERQIDWLFE